MFSRTTVHVTAFVLGLLGACAHPAPPTHPAAQAQAVGPASGRKVSLTGNFDPVGDRLLGDAVANAAVAAGHRDFAAARAILEPLVAHVPPGWKPETRAGKRVELAAWGMADMIARAARASTETDIDEVAWVGPSYSRAYGLLGAMAVEDGDLAKAVAWLDAGIALEEYPELLSERATVALEQHDPATALALYERGIAAAHDAPAQQARAWRGKGEALIDLDRLDDAEQALRTSLELEPDSKLAANELEYIRGLRDGTVKKTDSQIMR